MALVSGIVSFNGTACTIPPRSVDYSFEEIENVMKTEAGTDLVSVTRLNKHVFKFGWENVPSTFLDTLEAYALAATVTVGWRSKTYTCRIRDFSPKMVSRSEAYGGSDGLWNISLTAKEI